MVMKIFYFLLFLAISQSAYANEALLAKANQALASDKYDAALEIYRQLEAKDLGGLGMYQNIGLLYAKINQYPQAILYFEKALKYNPNDTQLIDQLAFARKQSSHLDAPPNPIFIVRFMSKTIGVFHSQTWAVISLIFLVIISVFFIMRYPEYKMDKKAMLILGSLVLGFAVTTLFSYIRYQQIYHNKGIIITSPATTLKLGPDKDSPDVSELHPGTKVYFYDHLDTWWMVTTEYGYQGWIPSGSGQKI